MADIIYLIPLNSDDSYLLLLLQIPSLSPSIALRGPPQLLPSREVNLSDILAAPDCAMFSYPGSADIQIFENHTISIRYELFLDVVWTKWE